MKSLFHRLNANEEGVGFIEFAFAAPFLLLAICGGIELANYALAHLRVNQIAMTVADNAGRIPVGVDEANIYEVFEGARVVAANMNMNDDGRVVLSSLQNNRQTGFRAGQTINWQRCWGGLNVQPAYGLEGKGANDSSLRQGMGADSNRIIAADGTAVMFVEVTYQYDPLIGVFWTPSETIRHESAFNVRGRVNQDLSNTQRLPELTCA